MKLDLFGTPIEVIRARDRWQVFYLGNEGKRRPARDIVVPGTLSEADLLVYLDDLYDEWASDKHPEIRRLD